MEEAVVNVEEALQKCHTNDWKQVNELLKKVLSNEPGMRVISSGLFLQTSNEILKLIAEKLSSNSSNGTTEPVKESAAECFRCLRQVCALNSDVQSGVSSCADLLENSKTIVDKVLKEDLENDSVGVLKCAMQFAGNACVSNVENQRLIWATFNSHFKFLLHHKDSKLCDYACMVVHSCLSSVAKEDQELLSDETAQDVVMACIQGTTQRDMEWGLYVLEDMLKNEMFLPKLYLKLDPKERLLLVEVILAEMSEIPENSTAPEDNKIVAPIAPANLSFLANHVKQECNQLLKLKAADATDQELALVIVKELEIIGMAASHVKLYPQIQEDAELLTNAVNLLHSIHSIGKSGNNAFTKVEKASSMDSIDPHHPVYGLKKDLIRLIANMAFNHRANQDLVRTLEGIPLLLDLTTMDLHNPFITQWVVLAIRNLLEGNVENRQVMTGMSLQGLAGHLSTLREMGVHTELRGGKIVVKPVKDQHL